MMHRANYDVVIVGGAIYGSSVAWWLSQLPGFQGRVAVIERDPSYEFAATSHTNSCIRQQFSSELNIAISQFGADFIHGFKTFMGEDAPDLTLQSFGYMYLANSTAALQSLRDTQQIQARLGAATRHLTPSEIAHDYPFYQLDDILGANHNLRNEGYFDGGTMFDWFRRKARDHGVTYIHDEVVSLTLNSSNTAVDQVTLKSGDTIACRILVNAAGTRGAQIAQMAGIPLPVEPRKRYTYVFDAAHPLDRDLPLTIDPSGVHMRSDGAYYMAGGAADEDPAVDVEDFTADHGLWEEKFWPIIANRIPQFERIKLINMWVGHYDYNTLDQNAIVGPHPEVGNFIFANGFSGHGLQQSPAIGRGIAEFITHGAYQSLNLSAFGYDRVAEGRKFVEKAVI